jgi:hypothetical protein
MRIDEIVGICWKCKKPVTSEELASDELGFPLHRGCSIVAPEDDRDLDRERRVAGTH